LAIEQAVISYQLISYLYING